MASLAFSFRRSSSALLSSFSGRSTVAVTSKKTAVLAFASGRNIHTHAFGDCGCGNCYNSNNQTSSTAQCRRSFTSTVQKASTMDTMKTGTEMYMSLYPESSTDGGLRLGNVVPDFSAETTHGPIESFHEWKKGKWAILFSVSLL